MNSRFKKVLKEVPLDIRLRVSNQAAFITLLSDLGFIEEESWSDDRDELLSKIIEHSEKYTKELLDEIRQWEEDGRPLKVEKNNK